MSSSARPLDAPTAAREASMHALMRAQPTLAGKSAISLFLVGTALGLAWSVAGSAMRTRQSELAASTLESLDSLISAQLLLVSLALPLAFWVGRSLPRVTPFERSMPVTEQRWLQAKLLAGLCSPVLMWLGAGISMLLVAALRGPHIEGMLSLLNVASASSTVLASSFLILGDRMKPSWGRVCASLALLPLAFFLLFHFGTRFTYLWVLIMPAAIWLAVARVPQRLVGDFKEAQGDARETARSTFSARNPIRVIALHPVKQSTWWWEGLVSAFICAWAIGSETNMVALALVIWFALFLPQSCCQRLDLLNQLGHLPLQKRRKLFTAPLALTILWPLLGAAIGSALLAKSWSHEIAMDTASIATWIFLAFLAFWSVAVLRALRVRIYALTYAMSALTKRSLVFAGAIAFTWAIVRRQVSEAKMLELRRAFFEAAENLVPLPSAGLILVAVAAVVAVWHLAASRIERMEARPRPLLATLKERTA